MASIPLAVITATYVYGKAVYYGCCVAAQLAYQQLLSPTKCLWKPKIRNTPPKCLTAKEAGQHGYVTVKGLKFHYVEKGDRSKPLMLMVHGFPEFWYSWRHQMKEFSKDYWTVAIDMRGYGDSDKPSGASNYAADLLVDDIKGIVTELGRKTFILVAHDWGSVVSWIFVDKYPEMLEKYILMNGAHPKVFQMMMKDGNQSSKSWYVYFFQLPFLPEVFTQWNDFVMMDRVFLAPKKSNPHFTEDDIEAFKYTFSQPGAITPPINYYRAALRRRIANPKSQKSQLKKESKEERPPGLYIFGAKDIALDIKGVPLHKELFENLDTIIVPEGNHFVQQDEPKAVNDAMRSFLQ